MFLNVLMHCQLINSSILTVWSELLETKCLLSREKATFRTHEVCPDTVPVILAYCLQQVTHHICSKKELSNYHSFTYWALKQLHLCLYKMNPTIHFRRQKFPVRHTTKSFYVYVQYSPISTFCNTNTKNELAPKWFGRYVVSHCVQWLH